MEEDFQNWWNDNYFHTTDPRYPIFKRLAGHKADFRFIDFLCDMLRGGDYLRLLRPESKVDRKRESIDKFLRSQGDEFKLLLRFITTMVVGFTTQAIAKKHLPDEDPLNLLSAQDVKGIVSLSLLFCAGWMSSNAAKKAELSQAQQRQELEHFEREHGQIPIIRLFLNYNKPTLPRRGNKADPWGSLFLLAVSQHLREKTGKPHYGEAGQLLGKTRVKYEKKYYRRPGHFPKTNAQSSLVRVKNFKKANPSWQEALSLFKDQFRLSPKSNQHDRS